MKKYNQYVILALLLFVFTSCNNSGLQSDASGNFESDEVIVSAEQSGKLLSFNVNEGDTISKGKIVGYVDVSNLALQKAQVEATILSLNEKTTNPQPQVELVNKQLAVQQTQLDYLERERTRV